MKFSHFTFPVGGNACNAHCPFCISKMTGLPEVAKEPNWDKFKIACKIADKSEGLVVALITGKGEPTLYPDMITKYLEKLQQYGNFAYSELQTNGIQIFTGKLDDYLMRWKALGLQTIAISVVHHYASRNREVYRKKGEDHFLLDEMISKLRKMGFTVRICCMLLNGFIDSGENAQSFIESMHEFKADQITLRPINAPNEEACANRKIFDWTQRHKLSPKQIKDIYKTIQKKSTLLYPFSYGAELYGYMCRDGREQNVCISNCLTLDKKAEIRHLIFFPEDNGRIGFSWDHEAAVIV